MNTDSGRIYWNEEQTRQALARGEPVVPVSQRVAEVMSSGEEPEQLLNRAERRRLAREERRAARKAAR